MTRAGLLLSIVVLVLLVACGGTGSGDSAGIESGSATAPDAAPVGTDDPVSRAVEIAKAIEADPDSAEAVLERFGLTVEQYEELMYDISADPELTRAYQAALEN